METKTGNAKKCKKSRLVSLFIPIMAGVILLQGCGVSNVKEKKLEDLDYTVLREDEIPEELMNEIVSKQEEGFKLTYRKDEYLYIAEGFGKLPGADYSIEIAELYRTKNGIFFDAILFGPSKNVDNSRTNGYPYIVIKTENREEPVVYK